MLPGLSVLQNWQRPLERAAGRYAVECCGAGPKIARLRVMPGIFRQPCFCASFVSDSGLPAARRNLRRKSWMSFSQLSSFSDNRSKTGARSSGIAQRLSDRNCRPVQSSSCRYSANGMGRQPLFEARALGTGCCIASAESSKGLSHAAPDSTVIGPTCGTDCGGPEGRVSSEGIGLAVELEFPGQEFESVLQRGFAMLETLAGQLIGAAQERPADAAVDAVINSDFSRIEEELSWQSRHIEAPARAPTRPASGVACQAAWANVQICHSLTSQ